jgi:tetratricopeptide (TPR) repeat protein
VGRLETNPVPKVSLHLLDIRRSGLSGWVHVTGQAGMQPKPFAQVVADSLENPVRAAEATRECLDRRDRRDFSGAKDRARRAFQYVPNHPAAANCLAVVLEAEQAPPDSLIPVLERAVRGDSLNTRAWESLGRQYQAKGTHQDSLRAAEAFLKQLEADPTDAKLRTGIAALFITLKEYARARDLLNVAIQQNPGDLALLQLKARACEEGSLWPCLVEALAGQYELDSTLVGKLEFYGKIFGAAQQAGDTAAMLKWSGEAIRRLPNEVTLWRARAAALNTAGMTDSALVAYRRIAELDPNDIASPLRIAQILMDRVKIDSTVPLDTVTLGRVDSLLQRIAAARSNAAGQPTDTAVWMNVAVMYFQPGTQLVQQRVSFPLGIRWLERAVKYDVKNQLTAQANFFLGLAYFLPLQDFDAQLRERKSCAMVAQEAETVAKAKAALMAGRSVQPQTADQLLQYVAQFEQLIPQYRTAFKCR